MASIIGKAASSKVKKLMKNRVGDKNNPLKEEVIVNGEIVPAYRDIPDFIPEHDAKILERVKKSAFDADQQFLGLFGWEGIIGFFLPALGDTIGVIYSLIFINWACTRVDGGLPKSLKKKMLRNVAIDWLVGLVPVLGDIVDIFWRCNTKNVRLFEDHLRLKYGPSDKKARHSAGLYLYDHNKEYMTKLQTADVSPSSHDWDDNEEEHNGNHPQLHSQGRQQRQTQRTQRPQEPRHYDAQHYDARPQRQSQRPAGTTRESRQQSSKPRSDWSRIFGYGGKKQGVDLERGQARTVAVH